MPTRSSPPSSAARASSWIRSRSSVARTNEMPKRTGPAFPMRRSYSWHTGAPRLVLEVEAIQGGTMYDRPTSADLATEANGLATGLGILTFTFFPFALPALVFVVAPLALVAVVGLVLALPFVLAVWLVR